MKYITILVDGMADYDIPELGNKTPMEVANKPTMDQLAGLGRIGMVKTIPDGMSPGSDIANLSVMGYDPAIYHTGRSPLEAASIGVSLLDTDVTFRCNLVTLSADEPYETKKMVDHSSSEITTEEAQQLILAIKEELETSYIRYYTGVSYRHLIVWDQGPEKFELTAPHDILGKEIGTHLPKGASGEVLLAMMKRSHEMLKDHPVNRGRVDKGLNPANSIWIWGEGKKPNLDSFENKYGLKGAVISAVDLIHGIGILAGLKAIKVEGATGTIHSNFLGKARAAIQALEDDDFVYIHLEAPDECGHQGDLAGKIKSIEIIDEQVIKPIFEACQSKGVPFKIMVLPDHRTPIVLRTHSPEPVPYLVYDSRVDHKEEAVNFSERSAEQTRHFYQTGWSLLDHFLDRQA